jgi:hypothetical protein
LGVNISNGRKIDQMSIKYTNILNCQTLRKFTQSPIFWSENKPSGNPVSEFGPRRKKNLPQKKKKKNLPRAEKEQKSRSVACDWVNATGQ